jgi:hypothetical protein
MATLSPKLRPVPAQLRCERKFGEVSEWLKEHAWKVCIRQRIEGSNPSLTAKFKKTDPMVGFLLFSFVLAPFIDALQIKARNCRVIALTKVTLVDPLAFHPGWISVHRVKVLTLLLTDWISF